MDFAFWVSLAVFVFVALGTLEVIIGVRKIRHLQDTSAAPGAHRPKVSIVFAALNEAATIEPALQTLLSLDYPNLEIIAINDRSTDATPAILDRLAGTHPQLRVLHIHRLPPGWLGKNHALWQGALACSGDYLVFTDADVSFEPSTICRAVNYVEQHRLDHLTLLFDTLARTQLLRMLLLSVQVGILALFKPWKVNDSPRHFLGVGGFNMVRRSAYLEAGTHAALPLAVLDDIMLGKLLKMAGCRQHVLSGKTLVSLEWYPDTPAMIKGLEKNAFAVFDYQIGKLIAASLVLLAIRVWPFVALLVTDGATLALNAATILAGLVLYADLARVSGWQYRCLVFAPVIGLIELAMWWRSALLILQRGGVEWRGHLYPLRELRQANALKRPAQAARPL